MLSLTSHRLIPKTWCRFFSFLERFCKKDLNAANDGGPNITIELKTSYKLYNLDEGPSDKICLNAEKAANLYREMQTIRRFENACANLYQEKVIRGFCHLYVGQEACCVGIKACMRPQDTVITSYRSHGWTYLMGVSVYELIAELCQKQTGCSRAKGGSMHTYGQNFFGGNGIVGAQTPLGAGVALAHAYRCDGGVNFACYGDGGANQGQLHEAFNIACLWKLPVVFVCENNKYGMGTPTKRHSCNTDYYTRGDYIPGLWVDGSDVLAVHNAAKFVIDHARSCGPIVMELETYRYFGHSMSDPGTSYRTRDEVQLMREKNDPLTKYKELCLQNNLLKEEDFKKFDATIKAEVADAVKQAVQDKEPELSELTTDVYANNLEGNIRNILRRDLEHHNKGMRLIPEGVAKATPKSDIKEVPNKAVQESKPSAKESLSAQETVKEETAKDKNQSKADTEILATKSHKEAKVNKDQNSKDPQKK